MFGLSRKRCSSPADPPPTVSADTTTSSIFRACPVQEQEKAIRPNQVINWEQLGLSAGYQMELNLDVTRPTQFGPESHTYANFTGNVLDDIVPMLTIITTAI